jgi:predicted  nucleic acid-binding Zn-ribbon protein
MQIYDHEHNDGLSEVLAANNSVTYASQAVPCDINISTKKLFNNKSLASYNDNDLYYVQSILVSSSWNKNDDIFDKVEIWNARHTPEDKPTNLEHDESVIIGHIISNWPITEEGIVIDDNTPIDNLPNKYHILTGSVIYRAFSSEELKNRAESLIASINNGSKYVSMECFFKGFDYGLLNKSTGEYNILSRNNETAYLTKFLRAYGGAGEHEDYKIGRVLRHITFSGKGYVDKPANEDSIIFSKNLVSLSSNKNFSEKNTKTTKIGVLDFQLPNIVETKVMSSEEKTVSNEEATVTETVVVDNAVVAELTQKIEELTETKTSLANDVKQLRDELAKVVEASEAKETELQTAKKDSDAAAQSFVSQIEELNQTVIALKQEIESANEVLLAYKHKEEEMIKKEKKDKRVAMLVNAGVSPEMAESTVDKFESLEDDAFETIAALCSAKTVVADVVSEKSSEEEKSVIENGVSTTESADASILDNVDTSDNSVNLGVGHDENSAIEATRAALVEFVTKTLNKGHKLVK